MGKGRSQRLNPEHVGGGGGYKSKSNACWFDVLEFTELQLLLSRCE